MASNIKVDATQGPNIPIILAPERDPSVVLTPEKVWGTKNYESLENKPQINGVELNKNTTLDQLGVSTEQIDQSTEDIIDIYDYLDTVTPKNTSEKNTSVQIKDALPLPIFKFSIDGNSQQTITEGYNLYNNNFTVTGYGTSISTSLANNGVKITINTVNKDVTSRGFYFPLKQILDTYDIANGEKILIKYKFKTTNKNVFPPYFGDWEQGTNRVYSPSSEKSYTSWTTRTIIADYNKNAQYGALIFYSASVEAGDVFEIRDFMICKSSKDIAYEMPTGGKPSPSINYKQPIYSVDTFSLIKNGKNLFNYTACDGTDFNGMRVTMLEDGGLHVVGMPTANYSSLMKSKSPIDITKKLIDGETYTISQNIPGYVYLQVNANPTDVTDKSNYIVASNHPSSQFATFKVDKKRYKQYTICVQTGLIEDIPETLDIILYPQLERGNQPTDFEQYVEEKFNFDLKGNTIDKLDDNIKDYLIIEKKRSYLLKNTKKSVFNGSEDIVRENTSTENKYRFLIRNIKAKGKNSSELSPILCDSLLTITRDANWFNSEGISYSGEIPKGLMIYTEETSEMTNDDFKTWLSEHNMSVCYQLETPEIIDLGESPSLLSTNEGVNNIYIAANINTNLEVLYPLDIKKYYDDKIAVISSQII